MTLQWKILHLTKESLKPFFQVILMATFFILPAYSQIVIVQDEPIQESISSEHQQSDADILRSLDNFGDEINDSMLMPNDLQSSESLPKIDDSFDSDKIDEALLDNLITNDSFEDLDWDEILVDEQSNDKINTLDEFSDQVEYSSKIKPQGVGVNGAEEALINKLDNSDLMDFDKDADIWGKEVLDNKDLLPSAIDNDELDLEQMDLNAIEFMDDIDDIDGVYLEEL